MRTQTDKYGNISFHYDNIAERRGMATGMNLEDAKNGIPTSQKTKYERPYWGYVGGILNGNDNADMLPLTCLNISERLERHGLYLSEKSIYRIIQAMKKPHTSVRRINRNHGQSCLEVLMSMGQIKEIMLPKSETGLPYDVPAFYFDSPHAEIVHWRKALEPLLRIKP